MEAPKLWTKLCNVLALAWHAFFKPIIIKVGKLLLAYLGEEVLKRTKSLVVYYNTQEGLTGGEKREAVLKELTRQLKELGLDVREHLLRLAIEVFVADVKNFGA